MSGIVWSVQKSKVSLFWFIPFGQHRINPENERKMVEASRWREMGTPSSLLPEANILVGLMDEPALSTTSFETIHREDPVHMYCTTHN